MKRVYLFFLVIFIGISCRTLDKKNVTADDVFTLTIFHINDSHSRLEPTQMRLTIDIDSSLVKQQVIAEIGGFSKLASVISALHKTEKNILTLHGGDVFQGTLFFTKYSGEPDAKILNYMNFDAAVLGNHEFDKGPETLNGYMKKINFPLITSNIEISNEKAIEKKIAPYIIKNFDGEKVAVIGLCLEEIPIVSNPGPNIKFFEIIDNAQKQINILKKDGINKIILLTHIGFEKDVLLAEKLTDVDVIVGGHTHTLLGDFKNIGLESKDNYPFIATNPEGKKTLVIQAYEWGKLLGTLKINFDKNGDILNFEGKPYIIAGQDFFKLRGIKMTNNKKGDLQFSADTEKKIKIEEFDAGVNTGKEIIDNISDYNDPYDQYKKIYAAVVDKLSNMRNVKVVRPDANVEKILNPYRDGVKQLQNEKIAVAKNDLIRKRNSGPGPIVSQSMLEKTSAQIAINNAGNIRTDILAGDITIAKIYEMMPFQSTLVLIDMKGSDVCKMIEEGIYFQYDNKKLLPDDYCGYMYVAGIKFKIDITKEFGKRISDVFVKDKSELWTPIDLNAAYKVVVTSFMTGGGDGYNILKTAPKKYDTGFQVIEVLLDYFSGKTVTNPTEELIQLIN